MNKRALWLAASFILCANAGVAGEGCDLTSTLEVARNSLAGSQPEAALSIRQERIALISREGLVIQSRGTGTVQLLELRDDIAVEVGFADLARIDEIASSFESAVGDADAELIVGLSQSAYVGETTCVGVDWTAAPVSSEFFEINGANVETRLTRAQAYGAVLAGQDPRKELVPALSIDLRLGERLAEDAENLSEVQPSLVLRPVLGRLSTTEVHIPSFALKAPRDTWLSDEIRYLSRVEEAEWRLGKASWEFNLSYSSSDQIYGGVYFPVSEYWSGEIGSSVGDTKSVSFALDRAFIWPEQNVVGSLSLGRLDGEKGTVAVSAIRDQGQAQFGGYIGLSHGRMHLAALFERSFGPERHAWIILEAASAGNGVSVGWSQRIRPRTTLDLGLGKEVGEDEVAFNAGLSFDLSAKIPARLSVDNAGRSFARRTIERNAETLRSARSALLDGSWSAVLE
jgi:hypothetical protein